MADPTPNDPADPSAATVALLAQLGEALGTAVVPLRLGDELQRCVRMTRALFSAAACSFARADPDGTSLQFVAADGAGADAIVGMSIPVGRGIAGWAAMSGDAIAIADVTRDARFARDIAEASHYVPTSIIAVPVVDPQGATLGVLEVLDAGSGAVDSSRDTAYDLAVIGVIAAQLASTVRLAASFDAVGAQLLRALVDPEGTGAHDQAITDIASLGDDAEDASLQALAAAFRNLADRGPAAARMAERILSEVAAYTSGRR